jgi:hypothetical protein
MELSSCRYASFIEILQMERLRRYRQGKGITDQDRNILSNQMLILGFLRSVVNCLVEGPVPTPDLPRKRKKPVDDDDDDDDEVVIDNASDEDMGASTSSTTHCTRGKVLITLRNVPPYSIWRVNLLYHQLACPLCSPSGTCQDWQRHLQNLHR